MWRGWTHHFDRPDAPVLAPHIHPPTTRFHVPFHAPFGVTLRGSWRRRPERVSLPLPLLLLLLVSLHAAPVAPAARGAPVAAAPLAAELPVLEPVWTVEVVEGRAELVRNDFAGGLRGSFPVSSVRLFRLEAGEARREVVELAAHAELLGVRTDGRLAEGATAPAPPPGAAARPVAALAREQPGELRFLSGDGHRLLRVQPASGRLSYHIIDPVPREMWRRDLPQSVVTAALDADGSLVALQLLRATEPYRTRLDLLVLDGRSGRELARSGGEAGDADAGLRFAGGYLFAGQPAGTQPAGLVFANTERIHLFAIDALLPGGRP